MSDIQWSSVDCIGTSDGGLSGFAAITDGIANAFGLSFEKNETISDTQEMRYYKIRSLTNCYIGFGKEKSFIKGANYYYKLQNEAFVSIGNASSASGTWGELTDTKGGVKCKRAEFLGYNFRVMTSVNNDSYYLGGFSSGKFTDYFSKKTYDVLIHIDSNGFNSYYIYDDENDNYTKLNKIDVGGSKYPTSKQNIAVATPIMFGNDKYYGYIGNQSSLYNLYGDYTKPGPITSSLGMQAAISNVSFRYIGGSTFIRSS